MSVQEMELFHGAVLAKLFRSDKPVSLRMVEMDFKQSRRAYLVNDEAYIYIKHSKVPRLSKKEFTRTWNFSFSPDHINDFLDLHSNSKDVFLALVCGQAIIDKDQTIEICFLNWSQIWSCIDVTKANEQQYVTVKFQKGYSFRVWGTNLPISKPILISQNALSDWTVPGV